MPQLLTQIGMIDSYLLNFAQKRLDSLTTIDQVDWSIERVKDTDSYRPIPPKFAPKLKTEAGQKPRILAEVKKSSPSLGHLSNRSALDICQNYIDLNIPAISVLVDHVNFKGHPNDLYECTQAFPNTPFLYKDFVASSYQVYSARAVGASALLLMTQLLESTELTDLYMLSLEIGLEPFIEIHDENDLEKAFSLDPLPKIIGINSRNFKDSNLPINLNTAPQLLTKYLQNNTWPENTILIAQSGIESQKDMETMIEKSPKGFPDAFQIGSSLSKDNTEPVWLKDWLST